MRSFWSVEFTLLVIFLTDFFEEEEAAGAAAAAASIDLFEEIVVNLFPINFPSSFPVDLSFIVFSLI